MSIYVGKNITPPRVILALVAGALLGGVFYGFNYGWGLYHSTNPTHGGDYFSKYGLQNSFQIGAIASVFWFIGLIFIAGPFWAYLHNSGKREFWHATLLGFGLLWLVSFGISTGGFDGQSNSTISLKSNGVWLWQDRQLTIHGWKQAIKSSVFMGFLGAVVGIVIWRISYRRAN